MVRNHLPYCWRMTMKDFNLKPNDDVNYNGKIYRVQDVTKQAYWLNNYDSRSLLKVLKKDSHLLEPIKHDKTALENTLKRIYETYGCTAKGGDMYTWGLKNSWLCIGPQGQLMRITRTMAEEIRTNYWLWETRSSVYNRIMEYGRQIPFHAAEEYLQNCNLAFRFNENK